jgi:hypothetical protein
MLHRRRISDLDERISDINIRLKDRGIGKSLLMTSKAGLHSLTLCKGFIDEDFVELTDLVCAARYAEMEAYLRGMLHSLDWLTS